MSGINNQQWLISLLFYLYKQYFIDLVDGFLNTLWYCNDKENLLLLTIKKYFFIQKQNHYKLFCSIISRECLIGVINISMGTALCPHVGEGLSKCNIALRESEVRGVRKKASVLNWSDKMLTPLGILGISQVGKNTNIIYFFYLRTGHTDRHKYWYQRKGCYQDWHQNWYCLSPICCHVKSSFIFTFWYVTNLKSFFPIARFLVLQTFRDTKIMA